jgi:hypothetical protein
VIARGVRGVEGTSDAVVIARRWGAPRARSSSEAGILFRRQKTLSTARTLAFGRRSCACER